MAYEIRSIGDDAVTLSDCGEPLTRIVSVEAESGQFMQVPVMRLRDAQRIVSALKLAEMVQSVVLNARSFDGAVVTAVRSAERQHAI